MKKNLTAAAVLLLVCAVINFSIYENLYGYLVFILFGIGLFLLSRFYGKEIYFIIPIPIFFISAAPLSLSNKKPVITWLV